MKLKNIAALALGGLILAGSTACYGPFRLTRDLHSWNGQVGDRWAQEAVFLSLALLQVYTLATLGDALIFNSIEFWTGRNPVERRTVRSIEKDGAQAVMSFDPERRRLRVDSFEKGRHRGTFIIEPGDEGMVARDGEGRLLMSARSEGSEVVLTDAL